MAGKNAISPSVFPLQGATIKLTPFNDQGGLDYANAIMNNKGIAGTLTITKTVTADTIQNERGDNLELPNDRKFNIGINMNSMNVLFHDKITSKLVETSSSTAIMAKTETKIVTKSGTTGSEVYDITLEKTPVVNEQNVLGTYVEDNKGNVFERVDSAAALTEGQYYVDTTTKKVSFTVADNNKEITIQYYYTGTNVRVSKENPLLVTKFFQLEIMDKLRGESDGSIINSYTKIPKVQITGDVSELAKQKSPNAPVAYSMTTAPIPVGVSPMEVRLENEVNI